MVASTKLKNKLQRLEDLHCFQNDRDSRARRLERCIAQRERDRLLSQCPAADDELIDRLIAMNFNADNLPALDLAPLAVVAWASGYVTEDESKRAILAIFDSQASGNPAAIECVRRWLQSRPPQGLLDLWEDYAVASCGDRPVRQWQQEGQSLLQSATSIAIASGGLLGFGSICEAEKSVLDRITRVYSLDG